MTGAGFRVRVAAVGDLGAVVEMERGIAAAPHWGEGEYAAILRADGGTEIIPSKTVTRLGRGDRVVVHTAGGGGYGDPAARDPALVALDRADGKVT